MRYALGVVLGLSLLPAWGQTKALTARAVVERIQKNLGVRWMAQTVDTFKDGDPETVVTGVATTMMATQEVLERAVAAGANLIITHEPVFYNHTDPVEGLEAEKDAVLAAKRAYIREHKLVIWRFHDHWHMKQPDAITVGLVRRLGWERYKTANPNVVAVPETTLGALAAEVKAKLGAATLRVVGRPETKVRGVGLAPGAPGFAMHRRLLQRGDVDALLMGEAQEWEGIEYGADANAQGRRKGLIVIGHIASEQDGMGQELVAWLQPLVPEVPVRFLPAAELFWAPK